VNAPAVPRLHSASTSPLGMNVWLRLGRVSNLPTVWSNVLAALALAGALELRPRVFALWFVFSLFYVGGMYLNDAFDRQIDAAERPNRPIPSGQVKAKTVFALGFSMLFDGIWGAGFVALLADVYGLNAVLSGAALAGLIVLYDAYHKQNPLSPVLMGACRVMVYVSAVLTLRPQVDARVLWGAAALWCYLIGLTYAAKQEAFNRLTRVWPLAFIVGSGIIGAWLAWRQPLAWPFLIGLVLWVLHALSFLRPGPERAVPQAVVRLIAGIALLDALLIASTGQWAWALCAVALCACTRLFQRVIPGT
jgi:hypothetical protein